MKKNIISKAHYMQELQKIQNKMIKEQKNTILETEKNGIVVGINCNGELEGIKIENIDIVQNKYDIRDFDLGEFLQDLENSFNKLIPKIEEKRLKILEKYKPEIERLTELIK